MDSHKQNKIHSMGNSTMNDLNSGDQIKKDSNSHRLSKSPNSISLTNNEIALKFMNKFVTPLMPLRGLNDNTKGLHS